MGRTRDRAGTEARLLNAVGALLAEQGFAGLGINAVAGAAGVDKVLIYRYFGGLPDLLAAFGERGDFWWQVEDLVGAHLPPPPVDTPAAWGALSIRRHLQFLRAHPVTRAILAWETVQHNALTEKLAAIREERSKALAAALGAKFTGAPDPRWRAVSALLAAACNYLVVRAPTVDLFSGVSLQSETGWQELEAGLDLIVHRVFVDEDPPARILPALD